MRSAMKRAAMTIPLLAVASAFDPRAAVDPLPSWNEGPSKRAILRFVDGVTAPDSPQFVPPEERIAVFDNDGTLWPEKPIYFQLVFALDRIKALAKEHPGWARRQPFKAVLEGDMKALAAGGPRAITEVVMATHAGMTTDQFRERVERWIATARHPRFDRPYTELVYQPMLELIDYLAASGFKVYIVSGGGVEFLRVWSERVYRVPPERVIGSTIETRFEVRGGEPVLMRLAKADFVDDGKGKPVAINQFIGRRPIAAFGNSDGDLEMLEWTTSASGARFGLIVHHTDGEREWKYDRTSHIGKLDEALDQAARRGWTVVDMKRDWGRVYPAGGR